MNVTEAANEAKDNVKFLYTLERFIEPLYSGTATTIIDTLPALMNSIKMIHTIARCVISSVARVFPADFCAFYPKTARVDFLVTRHTVDLTQS